MKQALQKRGREGEIWEREKEEEKPILNEMDGYRQSEYFAIFP